MSGTKRVYSYRHYFKFKQGQFIIEKINKNDQGKWIYWVYEKKKQHLYEIYIPAKTLHNVIAELRRMDNENYLFLDNN